MDDGMKEINAAFEKLKANNWQPVMCEIGIAMLTRLGREGFNGECAALCIINTEGDRPMWDNYYGHLVKLEDLTEEQAGYLDVARDIYGQVSIWDRRYEKLWQPGAIVLAGDEAKRASDFLDEQPTISVPEVRRSLLSRCHNEIAVSICFGFLVAELLRFLDPAMRPMVANILFAILVFLAMYAPLERLAGTIKRKWLWL